MPLVRVGAILEVLGAVGVVLPWATGIASVLTPLAATGFAAIMVVAISSHLYLWRIGSIERRSSELRNVLATSAILTGSLIVAVARFADLMQ